MPGSLENLAPELVEVLEKLEQHMGFDLTITSGYRTPEHNLDPKVGGVVDSEHTYNPAEGVDILCRQSVTRFKMVKWLLANNIQRIGIGNSFIHIGIADDKPQFVMWDYYEKEEV